MNLLTLFWASALLAVNSIAFCYAQMPPSILGQSVISRPTTSLNGIAFATRAHWMRAANQALLSLGTSCPFAAFGTAIVNHTANDGLGELVCTGANNITLTGNPTLHGEIAAIVNCTSILTDPAGPYQLNGSAASAAWKDLSLYTNAESCPMCASAVRWAGFKEYIYGTSIPALTATGWGQIDVDSFEIFRESWRLGTSTAFLGGVLTNETDPFFAWQFQPDAPCPAACSRDSRGSCAMS